jgi:hypothetical protein
MVVHHRQMAADMVEQSQQEVERPAELLVLLMDVPEAPAQLVRMVGSLLILLEKDLQVLHTVHHALLLWVQVVLVDLMLAVLVAAGPSM